MILWFGRSRMAFDNTRLPKLPRTTVANRSEGAKELEILGNDPELANLKVEDS